MAKKDIIHKILSPYRITVFSYYSSTINKDISSCISLLDSDIKIFNNKLHLNKYIKSLSLGDIQISKFVIFITDKTVHFTDNILRGTDITTTNVNVVSINSSYGDDGEIKFGRYSFGYDELKNILRGYKLGNIVSKIKKDDIVEKGISSVCDEYGIDLRILDSSTSNNIRKLIIDFNNMKEQLS